MDVFKVAKYVNKFKKLIPKKGRDQEQNIDIQPKSVGYSNFQSPPMQLDQNKPGNIWDLYVPQDSAWVTKSSNSPWNSANHVGNRNPQQGSTSSAVKLKEYKERRKKWLGFNTNGRLTGKLRFRKSKSSQNLDALDKQVVDHNEPEAVTCGNQFGDFCSVTSLHGYRYISDPKRSIAEKIFWVAWCIFGISAAAYMMSKIWKKWERNPIITSVATTNFPVSNIDFPAVTICTVNKAVTEKLIIQGCRYNFTLSQMKTIMSILVDPDSRNNDHGSLGKITVLPETSLKYLRLVAPKCDDYLLSCRWNSAPAQCGQLFRLVLTDSGYCCTFNSIETKKNRKDSKHDLEVMIQEQEYEYLQRAVWEYTDQVRKHGERDKDPSAAETPVDSFSCVREYEDDLFPGVCQYLQKCRESKKCREMNTPKGNFTGTKQPIGSSSTNPPLNVFAENFPLKVAGAGRSRGLTLMLDTLRCDSVPTDSFKGLRVFVHNADDFPAVAERGYIVGPGMETQIGVTATDTYSGNNLRGFSAATRGCFFPDNEFPLKFYKDYSRSACVVECETEFINQECKCVPYYSPGNYSVCNLKKYLECVKKAVDVIQKKTLPMALDGEEKTMFNFKSKKDREQEKSCAQFCLPSCNETFYNVFVTAADFPNQPQPNQTKMLREAILEGGHTHLNDINYVSGSISVLRIFFRESSIMQYKRDELFTWEDFVSNLGGVMGLCMGLSLLSIVEVFYFFTFRMSIEKRRYKRLTTVPELIMTGADGSSQNY